MAVLWGVRKEEARMPSAIKIDLDAPFLMGVCIFKAFKMSQGEPSPPSLSVRS
jgi:hypothetical protein